MKRKDFLKLIGATTGIIITGGVITPMEKQIIAVHDYSTNTLIIEGGTKENPLSPLSMKHIRKYIERHPELNIVLGG